MKKLLATLVMLAAVSVVFAGKAEAPQGAIDNPKSQYAQCHDSDGKWAPQNKNCDPNACGCLFHQLEEWFISIFD